jgi:DNA-binding MarR family transcriptional regulator
MGTMTTKQGGAGGQRQDGAGDPAALADEIGEVLLRLAKSIERATSEAAAPEGLSPLAARVLRAIGEPGSQRELGRQLGVGPAQVSVTTSELVSRRFVERKADTADHRLRRPQLTAKGRAAVARINARLAASSPVATALDERQMATLLRTLRRIDAADG